MVSKLKDWIRKYTVFLYYTITGLICWAEVVFLRDRPEYSFLITLIMVVFLVICLYNALFEGAHKLFFTKVICALLVIIFANQLYNYAKLIAAFPILAGFSEPYLAVVAVGAVAAVLLVIKLILSVVALEGEPASNPAGQGQASPQPQASKQSAGAGRTQRASDVIRIIIVIIILFFLIIATCYIFGRIYVQGVPENEMNFFSVTSFLISYGASLLMILLAMVVAVVTLLELIRFIYSRIMLFKQHGIGTAGKDIFSTYAFSIVIVIVLFYLSYAFSGFTMDDFTEVISGGQYLALPLTLLVVSFAFLILVRVVHGTILLLIETDVEKVRGFLKRAEKKMRLSSRIIKICTLIIDLILSTVLIALRFVAFIPNFFSILYHFVVLEDDAEVDPDLLLSQTLADGNDEAEDEEAPVLPVAEDGPPDKNEAGEARAPAGTKESERDTVSV